MSEERKSGQDLHANDLASRVEDRLAKGSLDQAKREFTQNWRDVVPDLPLRFSVILVRVNENSVKEALRKRREAGDVGPQLRLDFADEGRIKVRIARGKRLRLGDLPAADAELLEQLGKKARRLYRPQLLEVRRDDGTGKLEYVAVELVRAEPEQPGEHGTSTVPFHEALERIAAEAGEPEDGHPDLPG